jgi:hypothetical protein
LGQILASDWSLWSINISEGQKRLSCELTHYLIRTAKETAAEGPRFPDNYQDQEGSRGNIINCGGGGDSGGDGGDGGDDGKTEATTAATSATTAETEATTAVTSATAATAAEQWQKIVDTGKKSFGLI